MKKSHEQITKQYPMSVFTKHWNPLIRFQEHNRQRLIKKFVGSCWNKTIADIGCEEGGLSWMYADESPLIFLIDADKNVLDKAEEEVEEGDYPRLNQSIVKICCDAADIRLADNTCDIVLSCAILEHMQNPSKGIEEILRIVKPGGYAIISVPNDYTVCRIKKIIKFLHLGFLISGIQKEKSAVHIQMFDKKRITGMFAEESIKKYSTDVPFFTNHFLKIQK